LERKPPRILVEPRPALDRGRTYHIEGLLYGEALYDEGEWKGLRERAEQLPGVRFAYMDSIVGYLSFALHPGASWDELHVAVLELIRARFREVGVTDDVPDVIIPFRGFAP
jgi:hypothetical protein